MDKKEIKDRLFDILNETDQLAIQDIETDDSKYLIHVYLTDGTRFSIDIAQIGTWGLGKI